MKRTILGVAFLTSALSFTVAQKTRSIKVVKVTPETIKSQPVIDLSRQRVVYEVAAGTDLRQVQVHTAKGDEAMSDVAKRLGAAGGSFLIGTLSDLFVNEFGVPSGGGTPPDSGGGTSKFTYEKHAGVGVYSCTGRQDCSALSASGNCGDIAYCGKQDGEFACACIER